MRDLNQDVYTLEAARVPLLVSMPHTASAVPDDLARTMTAEGRAAIDADWHIDRLYAFARELGAGMLTPRYARYVVDLNRDPSGASLYPGRSVTELCPTTTFDEAPIYRDAPPDAAETARRISAYWRPYHDALGAELRRIRETHGVALLFDAHSIRSVVPRFFDGRLPDLNLGFGGGTTAFGEIVEGLAGIAGTSGYSHVVDGRFKGGYITRHYGAPGDGIHAIQLELAQATYMDEAPPFSFDEEKATALQAVLRDMLGWLLDWAARR
ncbi:N-formylglutamate deformylase [Oceanibacterium hippocampi]|uniref:N-formylglutamate deformylase n=1 Tax=Oceanibacterium hippocampi TaxID=745714 RepID=UPI001FE3B35B|nr:N-formylglutamate deformylase [Oceanibacterium hippocampi]